MNYFVAPGIPKHYQSKKPLITTVTPDEIHVIVCEKVSAFLRDPVDPISMKRKTRKRPMVYARQISAFFTNEYCIMSLQAIGNSVSPPTGRKFDHASVLHCFKTVKCLMDSDKKYENLITMVRSEIEVTIAIKIQNDQKKFGLKLFESQKK